MNRRPIQKGDYVIIDYPTLNAIAICTDMSFDSSLTSGIAHDNVPAYRFDYIAGLSVGGDNKFHPLSGFIWLNDDTENIDIVGVNGVVLPRYYYGLDLQELLGSQNADIDYVE